MSWCDTGDLTARLCDHERLAAIGAYDLLDHDLRRGLDLLCEESARRLDHPKSAVTVLLHDTQFFAGSHGLTGWAALAEGAPAEWSFCAHSAFSPVPYVVPDAAQHPVHRGSPLVVEGQRSYAGVALRTPAGVEIGAHCVLDDRPRRYGEADVRVLDEQATRAVELLERFRRSDPAGRQRPAPVATG